MKAAKKFYGVVTTAENRKTTHIEESTSYSSKKAFAEDLRLNGYKVKFVFSDEDYQKVVDFISANGFHMMNEKQDIIYQHIAG